MARTNFTPVASLPQAALNDSLAYGFSEAANNDAHSLQPEASAATTDIPRRTRLPYQRCKHLRGGAGSQARRSAQHTPAISVTSTATTAGHLYGLPDDLPRTLPRHRV